MDVYERLDSILADVDSERAARDHPPKVLERFDRVADSAAALRDALTALQDLVVISGTRTDDLDMAGAAGAWQGVPADRDHPDVTTLISASPTLSELHRAGVDLLSVRRYGEAHLEVAQLIGKELSDAAHLVRRLDSPGDIFVSAKRLAPFEGLVRTLIRQGWLEREPELLARKASRRGEDKLVPRNELSGPPHGVRQWCLRTAGVRPPYRSFVQGHWLNAYAYAIAMDQFGRGDDPFEGYSNVQYRLPPDMGGGRSDVDVLLRTKDQILSIECKSGYLLGEYGPKTLARVADNARRIDSVLAAMRVKLRRTYLLVHLGDDDDAVRAQIPDVDNVAIKIVQARNLRPFLGDLAGT